jgi:hypothetical protein
MINLKEFFDYLVTTLQLDMLYGIEWEGKMVISWE